ncbi:hypothetical protein [Microvirga roseola]|uniref:hypothetical protein n=1 Tax=Microvirga roseola TaxID=2883126 RepID=UPI001E58F916|nr:hypothetical protein [Microvirga roseola]
MGLDQVALGHITKILESDRPERQKLEQTLRALAKWRSQLIGSTLVARAGTVVQGGPFKGMTYVASTSEGGIVPKLLGVYETALHDVFLRAPEEGYDAILNVGSAEGFYAVGCARLLPEASILAWDVDPVARQKCLDLARLNGVETRIALRERFETQHLNGICGELSATLGRRPKGLLVMDCEGAEFDLLDPKTADFSWLDLVVEVHPGRGRAVKTLAERFESTHSVELRQAKTIVPDLPPWLENLGHLDQLLAVWEWRAVPTPWLVMRPPIGFSRTGSTRSFPSPCGRSLRP